MGRAEISWKKRNEEGEKREVYAKHVGNQWVFFDREKRFDDWQPLEQPSLDDWMELLDGVRRRINRRLLRPEEEERVIKAIRLRFPDAELYLAK
jgi:hypothetical protein